MMILIFLMIIIGAVTSEGKLLLNGTQYSLRIAGGEAADIRDYPYQVSLTMDSELCGGAIIGPKHILTAAHCTRDKDQSLIIVRAGSNFSNKGGKTFSVLKVYEHPEFDPETYDADVAVIELSTSLNYGETINSINLATANYIIESYLLATVTGYGYITHVGPASNSLRKVELPIISTEDCQYIYGEEITDKMFCAGYQKGEKDACQGDSGGPLVRDNIVIGVVSFGPDCASAGMPGGYTKIPAVIQFIDSVLNGGISA